MQSRFTDGICFAGLGRTVDRRFLIGGRKFMGMKTNYRRSLKTTRTIGALPFVPLLALLMTTPVEAATLSSSDSFDPTNGLWTYNYTVDNTGGSTAISEVDILINGGGFPVAPPGYYSVASPIAVPYTAPTGWGMVGSTCGPECYGGLYSFSTGPYNWMAPGYTHSILPGDTATFSLKTTFAPTNADGANDYFLGGNSLLPYSLFSLQAYGNVIVPSGADWVFNSISGGGSISTSGGVVGVPSPVVGAGLPGLIFAGGGLFGLWRRKRKAEAAACRR
jgi:hypothetical protein